MPVDPSISHEPHYLIGFLDLETWSKGPRAALLEVGCLVYDIQEPQAYHLLTEEKTRQPLLTHQGFFPLEEQLRFKRVFDLNTFNFHVTHRGYEETYRLSQAPVTDPLFFYSAYHLTRIKEVFQGCQEIWINGLSFDPPIIKTLWEDVYLQPYNDELWPFRAENDIRTMRKAFSIPKSTTTASHHAIDDCIWAARTLGQIGEQLNILKDAKANA